MSGNSGPLSGVRILDATRVVAGPYATGLLADLGARVVKLERPERGDELRLLPDQVRGLSVTFNDLNRDKEGITLDLRTEQGRELLLRLLPHFDVLTENFTAGRMDGWGLRWDVLRAAHPGLVYASLSGFGHDGPHAGRQSYDLVAQAVSGFMALTGEADGPPLKTGVNLADYIGGLFLALGILAALRARDHGGEGQRVDISNQDALVTMLDSALNWFRAGGEEAQRNGNFHRRVAPYGAFQATDGWVVIAVGNPRMFRSTFRALGREELLEDPEFRERLRAYRARGEITDLWREFVAKLSCAEVERLCGEHGIGFGKVQTVSDLASDPQLQHREMLLEIDHPDGQGPIPTRGFPIRVGEKRAAIKRAAPALGEHTEAVLSDCLGLSEREIAQLRSDGII